MWGRGGCAKDGVMLGLELGRVMHWQRVSA